MQSVLATLQPTTDGENTIERRLREINEPPREKMCDSRIAL